MKFTAFLAAIILYLFAGVLVADCLQTEKFSTFETASEYRNTFLHCLKHHNVPIENYNELLHEALEFNKRRAKNSKAFDINHIVNIWIPKDQRPYTSNKKLETNPNFDTTAVAPAYIHNLNKMYYPRGSLLSAALIYGNEQAAKVLLDFGANPNMVVLRKLKLAVGKSSYRQVMSPLLAGLLGKVSIDMWKALESKGLTQLPHLEKFEHYLPEPKDEEIKELLAKLLSPGNNSPKIDLTDL
ncbi:MAG: hypothetical protein AB8G05_00295 [Oligoflexales bacterium]